MAEQDAHIELAYNGNGIQLVCINPKTGSGVLVPLRAMDDFNERRNPVLESLERVFPGIWDVPEMEGENMG